MFLVPSIGLGLLFAVLLGGKPSRLQSVRFRHAWAVLLALSGQLVLFLPLPLDLAAGYTSFFHSCTYALLAWFAVANFGVRRLLPLYAGLALNALAILANGGRMPVAPEAARAAGIDTFRSVSASASHLRFLGDVFAIPRELPLANVFSVGDVLIGLGAIAFIVLVSLDRGDSDQTLAPSRLLEPLSVPAFRRLAVGKLLSQTGDWLTFAVLVGWTYQRTGSTGHVAAFFLVRLLPGILAAISGTTAPSLVPALVGDQRLAAANATLGLAKDAAMAFGALGAGVALSSVGPTVALSVDLLTFAAAFVLFLPLRALPVIGGARSDGMDQSALRYLLSSRKLLLLVCSFAVATIATGLTNASLPRVLGSLGFGSGGYGFGLGALAIGLALGGTLVGFARIGADAGRWIGVGLLVMSGFFVVLALGHHAPTAILVIAAIGFVDGTTDVIFDTIIQREADPRRYGAIFGLASASFTTTMLLAVAVAPIMNLYLNPGGVLLAASLFLVGAGAIALFRTRCWVSTLAPESPIPGQIVEGAS